MDPASKLSVLIDRLLEVARSENVEEQKEQLLSDVKDVLGRLSLKNRLSALGSSSELLLPALAGFVSRANSRSAYSLVWEALHTLYSFRKKADPPLLFYVLSAESKETFIVMEKHIAGGSNGTVHEGYRLDPPSKVAVKSMRIPDRGLTQAIRELTVQRNLWHPNVVHFLCAAKPEPAGKIYVFRFVMEYCPYNLTDYLAKNHVLDHGQAYGLLQRLLYGYQALAARHVIHRDIKPDNVLFANESFREPMLADFGAARELVDDELAGTFQGTPFYMAPEVLGREKYDGKCDVWSFGMLFYRMVFGDLPFPHARDVVDLLRLIRNTPMFQVGLLSALPDNVQEILQNTLQVDPAARWSIETLSQKTGASERYRIADRLATDRERMWSWDEIGLEMQRMASGNDQQLVEQVALLRSQVTAAEERAEQSQAHAEMLELRIRVAEKRVLEEEAEHALLRMKLINIDGGETDK